MIFVKEAGASDRQDHRAEETLLGIARNALLEEDMTVSAEADSFHSEE